MQNYDLAIVGAGPVGLFATYFAQLHGLKTITFEALDKTGGQVEWLFPNKLIKDIPAFSSITGKDLIRRLQQNASSNFVTQTKIQSITKIDNHFILNDKYLSKTVLLTTGLGAFHPKTLPLKLTSNAQAHTHYFMTDPTIYKNKKVAVLGGGDSALDWALQLAHEVNQLTLIHRRAEFRGLESSLSELKSLNNVKILTPYLPKNIDLIDNLLQLSLHPVGQNHPLTESFDDIFVAYGFKSDNRLLRKWGLTISHNGIQVERNMATNIGGIYAAGDVVDYPGRIPMIALGFGEAQVAISNIMANLFPDKKITLHSTSI